jgi:hypothetical protein
MAHPSLPITFDAIPIDEARQMSRRPHMDPELYRILKQNIPSLDNTATHMLLPEGANPTIMKNRLLRIAAERGIPVTIRRVPGGLLFWHFIDEDLTQATEVASRLQTARRKRPRVRRRRT